MPSRRSGTSFDAILKQAKAKYVLGLTATPIRRDGQQPMIFMQCGPTRHTAAKPTGAPHDLAVTPCTLHSRIDVPQEAGIQDVFRHLAIDQARTDAIAAESCKAYGQGRKVLVLTERTEHLDAIKMALGEKIPSLFVLHGRLPKKQRATLIAELNTLPPDAPRVLLATGKLVGEGFDHPPLDTLVLAMPVSWIGTLQQYAGRLHREHATRLMYASFDFVDTSRSPGAAKRAGRCGCGINANAARYRMRWVTADQRNDPGPIRSRSSASCKNRQRQYPSSAQAVRTVAAP
jgi:superfamily II DNA or RNA helicase